MILVAGAGVVPYMSYTVSAFSGNGSGTEADPYQITNVTQLQEMQEDLSAHYILMNDIDASITRTWNNEAGFDPVGTFYGHFDGQNYTIYDLYINRSSEDYVGLFSHFHGPGSGKAEGNNVIFENATVVGANRTAVFAGNSNGTYAKTFFNIKIRNSTVYGEDYVGGMFGYYHNIYYLDTWNISYCSFSGNISGDSYVGGLMGYAYYTHVFDCYTEGYVDGTGNFIGGLFGYCYQSVKIKRSFSTMDVDGANYVGGLLGWFDDGPTGFVHDSYARGDATGSESYVGGLVGYVLSLNPTLNISRCYSTGKVTAGGVNVGGLIGYATISTQQYIYSCFWDNQTSGQTTSEGGTGKTTAEMQNIVTYTDTDTVGLDSPWDFVGNSNNDTGNNDYWNIYASSDPFMNDGYPYLVGVTPVGPPENWWDSKWTYRKLIIMNSSFVDNNLTGFPLLIYNASDFDLATHAQENGDDIVFVSYYDNTTQLPHELEYFNGSSGEIVAWTKVNLSSSGDTKVWMYYHNEDAINSENPADVWSDYIFVSHMTDRNESTVEDVTGIPWHNGTKLSANHPPEVNGKIYKAQDFEDGDNDVIKLNDHNEFAFGDGSDDSPFSFSMWLNIESIVGSYNFLISKADDFGPGNENEYQFYLYGGTDQAYTGYNFDLRDSSANVNLRTRANQSQYYTFGKWHFITGTYSGNEHPSGMKIYHNATNITTNYYDNVNYIAMENKDADVHCHYMFL
jgi:hypothetical protein